MTDMNAAYIVVLKTSQREDVDETINAIKHIRGVISVEPVPEDIPEHIAEERVANEFSEKFSEMSTEIMKFLCERIERGKRHKEKQFPGYICVKTIAERNCSVCGLVLDERGVCQNINCDKYQLER